MQWAPMLKFLQRFKNNYAYYFQRNNKKTDFQQGIETKKQGNSKTEKCNN